MHKLYTLYTCTNACFFFLLFVCKLSHPTDCAECLAVSLPGQNLKQSLRQVAGSWDPAHQVWGLPAGAAAPRCGLREEGLHGAGRPRPIHRLRQRQRGPGCSRGHGVQIQELRTGEPCSDFQGVCASPSSYCLITSWKETCRFFRHSFFARFQQIFSEGPLCQQRSRLKGSKEK